MGLDDEAVPVSDLVSVLVIEEDKLIVPSWLEKEADPLRVFV